jgi:hypothetical protein
MINGLVVPVKGNSLMFIAVAALAISAVSAFVAYEYMYVSFEIPENFIFVGKTFNTSELYHTDSFSWYTYDQIRDRDTNPQVTRMTFEYDNVTYNGTPCLHKRDTYCSAYNTEAGFIQVNDWYFDADGKWIADEFNVFFGNGTFRNNGTFNTCNETYQKYVFILPYSYQIAPKGSETITVGNRTYVCDKYYLPNQVINGQGKMPTTYWFNASIPVPVKVQPVQGDVVFELVDWG